MSSDYTNVSRCIHSNRRPITKEDNRVHGSGKVHSWKTCQNQRELFHYKQKRDNRRSTVAGVYTSVRGFLRVRFWGRGSILGGKKLEKTHNKHKVKRDLILNDFDPEGVNYSLSDE